MLVTLFKKSVTRILNKKFSFIIQMANGHAGSYFLNENQRGSPMEFFFTNVFRVARPTFQNPMHLFKIYQVIDSQNYKMSEKCENSPDFEVPSLLP